MRIRRHLLVAAGTSALWLQAFGSPALAASVAEFDRASPEPRAEFLAVLTQRLYQHYLADDQLAHKATCMADLLTQQNAGGPPMVLSFNVTDIEFARRKDPHAYEV